MDTLTMIPLENQLIQSCVWCWQTQLSSSSCWLSPQAWVLLC